MKMKLNEDIELIDGYPYIYIRSINAVVGADFHLGYEVVLADEEGYFVPQAQYNEIISELEYILKKYDIDLFIVNGDLKHKFSMRTRQETREVLSFIDFINSYVKEGIVVRGNHDNFVRGLFDRYENISFVEPYYNLGNYIFTHGHVLDLEILSLMEKKTVIIGHEHPALLLYDDVGGKIKIPTFLFGKTKFNTDILVLPAVSPLMSGVEMNLVTRQELLSPILRETVDISNLVPYAVVRGREILEFPKLGLWSDIQKLV